MTTLNKQAVEAAARMHHEQECTSGRDWEAVKWFHRCWHAESVEEVVAAYFASLAEQGDPMVSVREVVEALRGSDGDVERLWRPVEDALVAQDRVSGSPEDNHDPVVRCAPQPEDVVREVLSAAADFIERWAAERAFGADDGVDTPS